MKWFKKHPDYLANEVKELKSNSNYQEKYSSRDNLLVSCGEIIVRSKETHKYPILIVYPESTPYSLPRVYLLENTLSEGEVKEISKKDFSEVAGHIRDKVKFYNLRHQGPEGNLCLVETDNLYSESAEIYSVRQVIDRVRDWFSGLNSGRLPPDSPEVELFFYFKKREEKVEFLLPELLFDDSFNEGVFYAALTPTPQVLKQNYIGIAIFGKNKSGIIESPKVYENEQHLLFTKSPKPQDILKHEIGNSKNGIMAKLKSGELVKVYWFDITIEPQPFEDVEDLASYVGDKDTHAGQKRMVEWLADELGKSGLIYLGLRFPGRRGGKEWQIFGLKKKENSAYILGSDTEAKIQMLNNYDVAAIYSEAFTDQSYHRRNSTRANRHVLKNERITVIGCGALGSEIADALAKAGVGTIHLVDKEMFRAHNSVRHLVSIDRMGLPKVLAVAERLILHNPFVNIHLEEFGNSAIDILTRNINTYFLEGSIGISTVADDNLEAYLNEQAIIYNKTIFYARALRGGKAARIFRVIPGKDACKNCLSLYFLDKDENFVRITADETLPTIANECNNPVRPASAADLKLISAIASRLVIDYLQEGEEDKNHWVWTTEKLEGISFDAGEPFVLHSSFLPPHPRCMYCREEDPIKVTIKKEALESMQSEISKQTSLETGGILIGYKEESGDVGVMFASEPGLKAVKEANRFIRDTEYCQRIVDENYKNYGDKGLYVGEWHYHPYADNRPSNVDLLSLSGIAEQKEYLLDKPVMIIFSNKGELSCTAHPFNKKYYFAKYEVK